MDTQDIMYEEEVARNPYHLTTWVQYIESKAEGDAVPRYMLYERAVKKLPRSYKLWYAYISDLMGRLEKKNISDKRNALLINIFERALVHLHKMPLIWIAYGQTMLRLKKGTTARKCFDRALQSLPVTQHSTIWELYIEWAKMFGVEETTIRVYRRYLMFDASHREDLVLYLEGIEQHEEAARQLSICLNDDTYVSPSGSTRHQLWMKICNMCADHPVEVSKSLKVDAIIRSGISRFSDEVGKLWCRLADYYTRLGQFENARDIYEEAIKTVITVRDFTIIFDAYSRFEESILAAKMQMMEQASADGADEDPSMYSDVELRMARLEYIMDMRPIWLNSVVLRQNPHNVHEWHKRAKMLIGATGEEGEDGGGGNVQAGMLCYLEAVKTIDPKRAQGRLSGLWMAIARLYEANEDMPNARTVLRKAVLVNYKSVEELASVWCAWGEMEMKHGHYPEALAVLREGVAEPTAATRRSRAPAMAADNGAEGEGGSGGGGHSADRLHKSTLIWSLYLDLEESLGTVETCRAAYDRCMELKVITPKMCLNYASFLEENNFFEDSFRVYERAVLLFTFPHVKVLWITYLDKFIARYEGSKLERLRDLFEQAVSGVPTDDAPEFYVKFAKAEELYGMARHAMAIYDRATRAVPEARRLDMYRLYILKVEQYYGITKTRPVYERAISELSDDMSKTLCIDFSRMERKLGEVDRARAVLQHGSQFADPKKDAAYWAEWREFEETHGNEDTFRDMLRVQRSIETAFSQVNYAAADMMQMVDEQSKGAANMEEMAIRAEMEAETAAEQGKKRKFVPAAGGGSNTNRAMLGEIDIDDDVIVAAAAAAADEEEMHESKRRAVGTMGAGFNLAEKTVPAAVFGKLKSTE